MAGMTDANNNVPAILLVCLGNICRSPMAEGALRAAATREGLSLTIDSAGTAGYHIGEAPDPRAIATAARHGVDISGLKGRRLAAEDFARFTHIFALDTANLAGIDAARPRNATAKISLLMDVVEGREGQPVADPYHGSEEDFEQVWQQVSLAADALVARLAVDA